MFINKPQRVVLTLILKAVVRNVVTQNLSYAPGCTPSSIKPLCSSDGFLAAPTVQAINELAKLRVIRKINQGQVIIRDWDLVQHALGEDFSSITKNIENIPEVNRINLHKIY